MTRSEFLLELEKAFEDEYGIRESISASELIGVAYTDVYDDDNNAHEMQIYLDLTNKRKRLLYLLDDEEICREDYKTYDDLFKCNFDFDWFQSLYGFFCRKVRAVKCFDVS